MKKDIITIWIGLAIIGLLSGCASTGEPPPDPTEILHREYSREVLRTDLEYLWDTLHEVHPDLYALADSATLQRQYRKVESALNHPMTKTEFYLTLAPLIAQIKDGHTYLSLPFEPNLLAELRIVLFPFDLAYIGDRTYILRDYTHYESNKVGAELIAIDGIPIDTLTKQFSSLLQGETSTFVTKSLESDLFKILFWMFYPDKNMWKVTYQQPGQSRVTEQLSGLTGNEILRIRRHISGLTQYRYSLDLYVEKKTAVLSLRTFSGTDLKAFYRQAFRKIHREDVEYLIIDLRNNLGGNTANADELLSYITDKSLQPLSMVRMKVSDQLKQHQKRRVSDIIKWVQLRLFNKRHQTILHQQNGAVVDLALEESVQPKPRRLRFDGEVFVLTNGHSFSAGAYFPSFIQHYNLGYIVGVETGGLSGGSFGEHISVTLPQTHLSVGISTMILRNPPLDRFPDHGVLPDYTIRRRISEEISGVDSQLQQTLEIVDTKLFTEWE